MKKLFLLGVSILAISALAQDFIDGDIMLNGVKSRVVIETNINTAKNVTIGDKQYQIDRINAVSIGASNNYAEVEVMYGDVMERIMMMDRSQLVDYFQLQNGDEVECNEDSKAFLVIADDSTVIGNCIN